jgi:thioredoxin
MAEIITINDSDVDSLLKGAKPTLLLISNGDDLRSDFSIAFKKAAAEKNTVVFARIEPKTNPGVVERFEIGSKAVLLGLYRGEELVRRSRPWGADVPLTIELLEKAASADAPEPAEVENVVEDAVTANAKEQKVVNNKPVHVTDATFQQEVIDYELPVVVDFWAEWCGPCRMVAPILDKLAEEFAGKLRIAKVDVDANPGLAQHFQITSIPTIMMLKNRTMVFSQPGALPEQAMRDLFTQLIALEIPAPEDQPVEEEPAQ